VKAMKKGEKRLKSEECLPVLQPQKFPKAKDFGSQPKFLQL